MFNKIHPELKEGEMWLTNDDDVGYYNIKYRTKRQGSIALTRHGKIIRDMYPVFIQISEFNEVQNEHKHYRF